MHGRCLLRQPCPLLTAVDRHALLDFRYRHYDTSGAASRAAHPAYETAGMVAGGTYAFGHVGVGY